MFRLGTFSDAAGQFCGFVEDDGARAIPVAEAAEAAGKPLEFGESLVDMLAEWPRAFDALNSIAPVASGLEGRPVSALKVLPPVPRPGKILNAAANYRKHVEQMRKTFSGGKVDMKGDYGFDKSKGRPYMFLRATSTIAGAFDTIELPPGIEKVDWEAELGAIIGPRAKRVTAAKAMDHVAGFTITHDVSCRDLTWREDRPALRSDWMAGKSFDTFAPTGPWFVPAAFVDDYKALPVRLWVNGELMQDGVAGDMIFDIAEQIEYASAMMALEPGDLMATGTPDGTGAERGRFLADGDIVEIEIDGLGRQRTPCRSVEAIA